MGRPAGTSLRCKRLRLGLLVALWSWAAILSAQPVITDYGGLTTNSGPYGIVAGPDGGLWFTEQNVSKIGRIDPGTGSVTEYSTLTLGSSPTEIALGPDNALWFTEQNINKIGRIDPSTHAVTEYPAFTACLPAAGTAKPLGIAAGPDNALWYTDNGCGISRIGRMTTTGAITQYTTGLSFGAGLAEIVLGPDNAMWFTESSANLAWSQIGRIAPSTGNVTEFHTVSSTAWPRGIVSGPDGALWFAETGINRIGRMTTSGSASEFSTGITPGSGVFGITAGPDSALWFTEFLKNKIGRITTAGAVTEYPAPSTEPWLITVGPDLASVWFAEFSGNRIGRVAVSPCNFSLSPAGASVSTSGGPLTVTVGAAAGCPWTATSPASWVHVLSPQSGTGNGTVSLSVDPNSGLAQTATVAIAGLPFQIFQAGQACTFVVAPDFSTSTTLPSTGGSGNIVVTASNSSCPWTVTASAGISTEIQGGSGNGSVGYGVGANTLGTSRVLTMTIGGQFVTLLQAGSEPCTYTLPQSSQSIPALGGSGTVAVIATGGCNWGAVNTTPGPSWITFTTQTGGSGNSAVSFSAAPNTSTSPRVGTINVNGQTFVINQAGAAATQSCTASVSSVPTVPLEGRTVLLGDLIVTCSGLTSNVTADVVLTLNTSVTNKLVSCTSGSAAPTCANGAQLLVNGANSVNGQVLGYGKLVWPAVVVPKGTSGSATLRITGALADASASSQAALTGQVTLSAYTGSLAGDDRSNDRGDEHPFPGVPEGSARGSQQCAEDRGVRLSGRNSDCFPIRGRRQFGNHPPAAQPGQHTCHGAGVGPGESAGRGRDWPQLCTVGVGGCERSGRNGRNRNPAASGHGHVLPDPGEQWGRDGNLGGDHGILPGIPDPDVQSIGGKCRPE